MGSVQIYNDEGEMRIWDGEYLIMVTRRHNYVARETNLPTKPMTPLRARNLIKRWGYRIWKDFVQTSWGWDGIIDRDYEKAQT